MSFTSLAIHLHRIYWSCCDGLLEPPVPRNPPGSVRRCAAGSVRTCVRVERTDSMQSNSRSGGFRTYETREWSNGVKGHLRTDGPGPYGTVLGLGHTKPIHFKEVSLTKRLNLGQTGRRVRLVNVFWVVLVSVSSARFRGRNCIQSGSLMPNRS